MTMKTIYGNSIREITDRANELNVDPTKIIQILNFRDTLYLFYYE